MCKAVILKTELGMEKYVANNLEVECEVIGAPMGFQGLVLLRNCKDPQEALRKALEMPEVIRGMVAQVCTKADLEELREAARELAKELEGKRFAVRTVRRGKHPFTSVQVNAELGSVVLDTVNAKVDLSNPEKVLMVEIIGDEAYLAVVDPEYAGMKKLKGKRSVKDLFDKLIVIQEPYLGPRKSVEELGKRIGRVLQSYGVKEYYFGLTEEVNAIELSWLIRAVEDGARARYEQAKRTEGKARKVELKVFDMYHLVGSKGKKEVVVIFEPEGKSFEEAEEELGKALVRAKRVKAVLGSRKGTPMGLYRFADFVVDIAPGVVLSTETALAGALESLAIAYLKGIKDEGKEE
ncbi:hypothetical protein IPA_02580 [Ignicoccus pacificus DSM 13166]|uniref:THUMP domain-containing protein n=1 Tax=Ignicoccus pacificus DSM 13166 TaxID=940294 RepID=A0A977K966_9CREN|nr:hypothetical protein IPA_02580 [Ignicoccus pacificus DSM 13166]